ncbi:MAG TPA: hemerythrin domain-containing protein [Phenylobacterium sp.]|nr:hemerythrin domain-containing protein [Phenylobacterium sp.]
MATNGKTDKIDAIKLLKQDHREVEDLFEQFEKARSDERKAQIVKKICTELIVHSLIEEEIFYPTFRGKIEDDILDEGYVAHDGAKTLIAELMAGAPGDPFYDAKVSVLSEEIEHHVKEEERPAKGMFAQCRATDVDLDALGAQMQARKQELLAQFETEGLPTPETRSFKGVELRHGAPPPAPAA